MNIGNKLKELRTEKGMSQAELGKILNTTGACISSWETGRTEPNIEQLKLLAKFFNTTPMSIIGDAKHDLSISAKEMNLVIEYRNAPEDIQSTVERLLAYAERINKLTDIMKGD